MSLVVRLAVGTALGCSVAAGTPAAAQTPSEASGGSIVDEVRVGALVHDARFAGGREPGADLNAELLFASPVPSREIM